MRNSPKVDITLRITTMCKNVQNGLNHLMTALFATCYSYFHTESPLGNHLKPTVNPIDTWKTVRNVDNSRNDEEQTRK